MKRKKENTLMRKMTNRVFLLFFVLLILSLIYSFFLVRFNGYSNMQKICYDESEMMTMLIDNMMYDMEAVASNYTASQDIHTLLKGIENRKESERIQEAFHLIEEYKPGFLTHKYFHSFCLVDQRRNSYYSFNNPGVSFLNDFEKLALGGESIDSFTGFTGVYGIQSSSGRKVPFYLISLVRDIYELEEGKRHYLGKVIITANIGDFLQAIQKESSFFDDTGILSMHWQNLYMLSGQTTEISADAEQGVPVTELTGSADKYEQKIQKLLKAEDFLSTAEGLYYKCRSQDSGIWLVLFKKNVSYIQYTDAYIVGFLVFMVCVTAGAALLMLIPVIRNFSRQIQKLETAFERVGNNEYTEPLVLSGSKELIHIGSGFNQMTQKIRHNTENMLQQERKQQELKFELLIAQMNPHFIYNTLNLVIYLARKNRNEDVIKVTSSFISLLQNAVYFNEEEVWSTVEKELEMSENYELIQKYRYGKTVTFHTELDEELRPCRIPRNILIPLVENALLHGICETDRDGTIRISFEKEDGRLRLTVADDGNGMSPEMLQTLLDSVQRNEQTRRGMYSIGLSNIYDRLSFLYQEAFTLTIKSEEDQGTIVTICLPTESK